MKTVFLFLFFYVLFFNFSFFLSFFGLKICRKKVILNQEKYLELLTKSFIKFVAYKTEKKLFPGEKITVTFLF